MRRIVTSLLTATLLLVFSVSATLAVPMHQHVLTTPSGQQAWIAQGICQNDLQNALDNFHANVHTGAPSGAFAASGNLSIARADCP